MNTTTDWKQVIQEIGIGAQTAARLLQTTTTDKKNAILNRLAAALIKETDAIVTANQKDLEAGKSAGLSDPLLERLTLNPDRIHNMAEGVRQVATLPDPVGETIESQTRPNGINIHKTRVPIGVIGIIYESRPNVTIDCAALCLKSGNAAILRGGKEAFYSNTILAEILQSCIVAEGLPASCVQLIPTTNRAALLPLLKLDDYVSCIIPRGGEALIRFVAENATIPVIKHYQGICNLYIDHEADLEQASAITINAKCQRPSVCNAIENLWIHENIAAEWLPKIASALKNEGVELRVDPAAAKILSDSDIEHQIASEEDYSTEFLDLILSIQIVDSVESAIDLTHQYGSQHSDAIITRNEKTAEQFLNAVDSSTVYWNASTRFTDGFEFGLGAEIGISTDKLHARGPMGLRELCTYKYKVYGSGQIK